MTSRSTSLTRNFFQSTMDLRYTPGKYERETKTRQQKKDSPSTLLWKSSFPIAAPAKARATYPTKLKIPSLFNAKKSRAALRQRTQ
jgi:hypothetical protein